MKNIIAVISGILLSLILFALVSVFVIKFNVEPYASFGRGKFSSTDFGTIQNNIIVINYFIVFPIISFITGYVVGLIAKNKEYILGLISIIPVMIVFFDKSISWTFSVIMLVALCLLGVLLSKRLKKRKAKVP